MKAEPIRPDVIRGHLDSLLLAALADGPTHGYGLIQRLRQTSGGVLELAEGTVYPALHRLERDLLVTSVNLTVDGRKRRSYHLTPAGERALTGRRREWARFQAMMTTMMGAPA